ncbi:MAG: tetratricopeptide repeat protein, partial [Pseudomonadota bacterium]
MTDRETDSFIREVTEEVRQDRMLIYWRRYGLYVIGGILSIVGLAAAWAWYQAAQTAAARERGAAFLALDPEDHAAAAALAGELEGDAGTLAGFAEAAALARAGEVEAAVAKYQSLSGAGAPRYTDLATLEAVRL